MKKLPAVSPLEKYNQYIILNNIDDLKKTCDSTEEEYVSQ